MKTEQTFITCDECNVPDATELRFAINGRNFTIDLCGMHRAVFDTLIQPYVTNGHPVRFNNHVVRKDVPRQSGTSVKSAARKAVDRNKANKASKARKSTKTSEIENNGLGIGH